MFGLELWLNRCVCRHLSPDIYAIWKFIFPVGGSFIFMQQARRVCGIVRTKQMLIWNPLTFFFSSGWGRYFQRSSSAQSSICFPLSRFDLHFQPWNYKRLTGPFSTPPSREIWNMIFLNLWQIFATIFKLWAASRLIAKRCCFSGLGKYFLP